MHQGVYDVTQDDRFKSGEMSEDELLREFLDKFDSPDNKDGTVTKEEFLSYYAGQENNNHTLNETSVASTLDSYQYIQRKFFKINKC